MDALNPDLSHSDFLKQAKEDVESAKILYQNKKYSQSVYLFQQSVEKACKYLGLTIKAISVVKLREISHNPHLVFKTIFTDSAMQTTGLACDFNYFEKAFLAMSDERKIIFAEKHILEASHSNLIILGENETATEALIRYYRGISICLDVANALEEEMRKSRELMPYIDSKMAMPLINDINDISRAITCEMILSFIVCGIEANSRYPDHKTKTTPQEIYAEDALLVKKLKGFIPLQEVIIKSIEQYYSCQ